MGMNDFQIGLIAALDGTKSKQQINQDIEALKRQLSNIEIQAKLSKDAVSNLTKQLNAAQINLQNVSIDQSAINNIIAQINSSLSNININLGSNLNSNGLAQNAQKAGQQIGQIISNEAQRAIGNVTSQNIGRYFRIDSSTSNQFHSEMEKLVSKWTNGKGKLTDIKVDTRTTYDNDAQANIERLHQATVTYKNDLDEVIKKTIAWRQIGTSTDAQGNETPIRGFVEVAGQYSKSLDTINQKTDTFIEKQKAAVTKAENTLNSIRSGLTDKGANRTLANTDFDANGLTSAISKVDNAIKALGNSTKATFADANNNVATAISELNDLITRLKNAEYAATSLRTKDINTIKIDENNKLDAFVEKMKQSGHYTDELKTEVSTLKNVLNSVFDANSLSNYLNGMSNLESKFKSVDAQAKTLEKDTKLQTNIESEKRQLQVYVNELKQAGVMSGEVKDKIQQMFSSLAKVETQTGLTTWRAELKGVKAETDEVLKSVQKLSATSIPQAKYTKIFNGGYGYDLDKLISDFQKINAYSDEINTKIIPLKESLEKMQTMSGSKLVTEFNEFETQLGNLKIKLDQEKLSFDRLTQPVSDEKISSLLIKIQNFMSKNTAITKEARAQLELYVKELSNGNSIPLNRWNEINQSFAQIETRMRTIGKLGLAFKDQWTQAVGSFKVWLSASTVVMKAVSETRQAVTEIKELDNIITEITKTSNLKEDELVELTNSSFSKASKFGKSAADYLTGVQEMSRSGFYGDQGEAMAEQSLLAQAAGDMTSELADKYVIATNAAYKFNGEASKINAVIDGQNMVCNRNSVAMTDMAEAMSEAGTVASSYRVSIEDLSAMVGTMEAVTKSGGSEVGNSIKSILINLQNVNSSKITKTLDKANASMTEMVNGAEKLRNPIAILRDLSKTFNELDEDDPLRAEILTNVGGKYQAAKLSALLQNQTMFDKMLNDYSEGGGSATREANLSANNLTGSLNKLSNTFTEIVNNITDSSMMKSFVGFLNTVLSLINKITSSLSGLSLIGASILGKDRLKQQFCPIW